MARFRRFRRSYRARSRGFRRSFRRYGGKGGMNIKYLAGAAAGFLAPEVIPYQTTIATVLAVAPVRVPYGLKGIAQGYVLGRLAKQFIPNPFGGTTSTNGDFV